MPINGYFDVAFASSGSKVAVPDAVQPDGSVSYEQGYGVNYTLDPGTNPSALNIEETKMNQLFFDITSALQAYQQNTIAPFITSTMNGGTPYTYPKYALVLSGGVAYWSIANGNADTPPSAKWVAVGLSQPSVTGFTALKIQVTGDAALTLTANSLTVQDGSGVGYLLSGVSSAINTATSGAGGLDTGSIGVNSWYAVWEIYNPSTATAAAMLSLAVASPTMPSGYTAKQRLGWVRTDGAAHLLRTLQYGPDVQYVVGTNPSAAPVLATGVAGNVSTPSFSAVSVSNAVPVTAGKIKVGLEVSGGGLVHALAAPNPNYGGITTANVFLAQTNQAVAGSGGGVVGEMVLESTNIYYAADAAPASLQCLGWTDNL